MGNVQLTLGGQVHILHTCYAKQSNGDTTPHASAQL